MSDSSTTPNTRKPAFRRLLRLFLPLVGITLSLSFIALIYFGYDLARAKVSPCDGIFEQATTGLTTKIEFLKAKGEIKLGRSKIAELDERAQMTALDLKTCCTVLDAGRINPEQFLTCKAKARSYDDRIDTVVAMLKTLTSSPAAAGAAPADDLNKAVDDARLASQELNRHITQVVAEDRVRSLQAAAVQHLKIDAVEREPNDDGLNANQLATARQIKAAISGKGDADVYTFTTPSTYRDWIRISIVNRSTALEPHLDLFDSARANIGSTQNTTAGGDLAYDFVATPATTYSFRVASHYGSAEGVYIVSVVPQKAYDSFEPNDDVLAAKPIAERATIKASIMDKADVDVFSSEGVATERAMKVTITNASATLHPFVIVYDAAKSEIGRTQNTTPGADLSYSFKAPKGAIYVRVADYYGSDGGAYSVTLSPE